MLPFADIHEAPDQFVPLTYASYHVCALMGLRARAKPDDTVFYGATYAMWQAIRFDRLQVYYVDPKTHRWVRADHANFREAAATLAAQAREVGANAVAEWQEGQRAFDVDFYRRLRDDERKTGRALEVLVTLPADLFVRAGDLSGWLWPLRREHVEQKPEEVAAAPTSGNQGTHTAQMPTAEEAPPRPERTDAAAPNSEDMSESRKYIYACTKRLLRRDPSLTTADLIKKLKQYHIRQEQEQLCWHCPKTGAEDTVSRKSFERYVRELRKQVVCSRN